MQDIVQDIVQDVVQRVQEDGAEIFPAAPTLRHGVSRERRISNDVSIEDSEMRNGRKSRSVRVDGYKRHVLHDLDSGLICAVGLTAANAAEASVTDALDTDLAA